MKNVFLFFRLLVLGFVLMVTSNRCSFANHVMGGDISWECVTSGPNEGRVVFYLTLYRDCSQSPISNINQYLYVQGTAGNGQNVPLTFSYSVDVSDAECGIACANSVLGVEKTVFESAPVSLPGSSDGGYNISYSRCCRGNVDNLLDANLENLYLHARILPYSGTANAACFDSSPRFTDNLPTISCAGSKFRYQASATDAEGDSVSYELVPSLGDYGNLIVYESGYTYLQPLPSSLLNSGYSDLEFDGETGIMSHDLPEGVQGSWVVDVEATSWRCGVPIAQTVRSILVKAGQCSAENNLPVIEVPTWTNPVGAIGYEVSVTAGDTVAFTLSGVELDSVGGNPQGLTFTASGSQFGSGYTDENSGCGMVPCATLSNSVPPLTVFGDPVSTDFLWVTSCDHLNWQGDCAGRSSTYHFQFKYRDGFCPYPGVEFVDVAVTVVPDSIVESPQIHCVTMFENGEVELAWEPLVDPFSTAFHSYEVYHSLDTNGPFQQIGSVNGIDTTAFVHSLDNVTAEPNSSGANFYYVRTRSGCSDQGLSLPKQTVSSIYLSVSVVGTTAVLSWNQVVDPPLPSSNGNGQGLYSVYREFPAGNWEQIGATLDTSYLDPDLVNPSAVNYRVELVDILPCISVSNVAGYLNNGLSDLLDDRLVVVSPNPNDGRFVVSSANSPNLLGYSIMDVTGRLLKLENLVAPVDRLTVDASALNGVYLLYVLTEKGGVLKRLIVAD